MELIIIALIAVEVVIVGSCSFCYSDTELKEQALVRDGPELWHMLFDVEGEKSTDTSTS